VAEREGRRGEQGVAVGGGEGELEVVAGVEPAALDVDRGGVRQRDEGAVDLITGATVAVRDEVGVR